MRASSNAKRSFGKNPGDWPPDPPKTGTTSPFPCSPRQKGCALSPTRPFPLNQRTTATKNACPKREFPQRIFKSKAKPILPRCFPSPSALKRWSRTSAKAKAKTAFSKRTTNFRTRSSASATAPGFPLKFWKIKSHEIFRRNGWIFLSERTPSWNFSPPRNPTPGNLNSAASTFSSPKIPKSIFWISIVQSPFAVSKSRCFSTEKTPVLPSGN